MKKNAANKIAAALYRAFAKDPKKNKGVALIVVLLAVTILTVVTMEFNFKARVNLRMAANMRDELRGEMLAQSSVNFMKMLLNLQRTVDQLVNKRFNMSIQLWQWVPLDSDLLRAFSGGVMAEQSVVGGILDSYTSVFDSQSDSAENKNAEDEHGFLPPGSVTKKITPGMKDRAEELADEKKEEIAKDTGFGDFDGHFMVNIADEDSKINVNVSGTEEIKALALQLTAMFQPKELDFLFERKDENGNYISRDELVSAIIDWVDQDNVRYGLQGGDENQLYNRLSDPYAAKNHFLDSVEEMRLIWGVDDRFWEIFGESFTIYRSAGTRSININTADAIVLEGLLRQCTNTTPTWNQIHMTLDQILKYRDQESMGMGFNSGSDFEQLASTYTQFEFLKGCLSKNAKTESNIFRIKATGEVGQVSITYEVVVDKNGVLYYFRIL